MIDDAGQGRTSDVIAAVDWILQNRFTYNIRVANFSLQTAAGSSILFDPLNRAIEQLWLNGVVVVAAAGNYAAGGAQSGVLYSPANDPFVVTVGALDIGKDQKTDDDVAAPWSAWGYTSDGFLKPEISAPGRYIVGACNPAATLCATGGQDPKVAQEGYLQLSGTSFAAPMVSAAAAAILALHPDWTPDQVKGQLMVTAAPLRSAAPGSVGVGELDVTKATESDKVAPPNPNLGLDGFVSQTANGPMFDAGSWADAAESRASWNSASWTAAASWSSAAWSSAAWTSAAWTSAAWTSAAWSSSVQEQGLTDNAVSDGPGDG